MYKKLEPKLLIYEKVEILESNENEQFKAMKKQLDLQGAMLRELQKNQRQDHSFNEISDIEN